MVGSGAEPAVRGGAPVGEQERAARVAVAAEETAQGRGDVPGAGGQVHERRIRVAAADTVGHDRHAGGGDTCVLVEDEGVPGGNHGARQHGDHDGVVDVHDDAELLAFGNDIDAGCYGAGTGHVHDDFVYAGFQVDAEFDVEHAAAVGVRLVLGAVDDDGDGRIGHCGCGEGAPAAHGVGGVLGAVDDLQEAFEVDRLVKGAGDNADPAGGSVGGGASVAFGGHEDRLATGSDGTLFAPPVQPVCNTVADVDSLVGSIVHKVAQFVSAQILHPTSVAERYRLAALGFCVLIRSFYTY